MSKVSLGKPVSITMMKCCDENGIPNGKIITMRTDVARKLIAAAKEIPQYDYQATKNQKKRV